jgi:hypothetical protein
VRYNNVSEATFVYCEKMDKKEFRLLMEHCFGEKKTVEAKTWLDKHYSDSAPGGKMNIEDDVRNARKRMLPTKTSKKSTK